ncbi:alpha/beta hydrolase [Paenibacillus albicereus]|uniref:Alpha/beta hydrolase n=1 Tax=Paenibacillus albicereus TaxID=2726185 RepID=A0A6H2H2U9_9BACL|nr:alpha/beta hydrolase [Paenibacillus albicereus]QJC54023.1 alpha/beta hydrolase [Paenibacillus albicereus]
MTREIRLLTAEEGTCEYSIAGSGPPVLLFHGGHSNCLEEFGIRSLLHAGYSVLIPSRAGYGRTTPLRDLEAACRLYGRAVERSASGKVHVIAVSAGGPSAIAFCSLYPERVASLVLQCAVAKPWLGPSDSTYRAARRMFNPRMEKTVWTALAVFSSAFPALAFRSMAPSFSCLPYSDVRKRLAPDYRDAFRRMCSRYRSGFGFLIDLEQTGHDYSRELAGIQAPSLVLHSPQDASVPFAHAHHAHSLLARSELVELDSWGHLIWLDQHAAEHDRLLLSFLERSAR